MPLRFLLSAIFIVAVSTLAADQPKTPAPAQLKDHRLTDKPRDLNGYFPFTPPTSKEQWEARRQKLRTQVLVAVGLWPMPERPPIQASVHSPVAREGYTVEKVSFASLPGHYVTGSLYRPTGDRSQKRPVVLCPHGHWSNGRMMDAGEKAAKKEIESGAEKYPDSARYIFQAKCSQLARMGCIVFQYDMVGVADSKALSHTDAFLDPESMLRLQTSMGLQTWNSMRALDFVLSLPDVDPSRVGVTGGSGGGTQTFILAALDDRVTTAFPAVMVSTAMQGGCVCENAPYLRIGTGNVEIAGLFAPKPLAMTGANDWTIDIETKGLPQLKALYHLYGAEDKVAAKCFKQFGHNYNQVSREVMYDWFNQHLKLGHTTPIHELPVVPIPPKELSVYDDSHLRPKDELGADGIKKVLTERSRKQMEALMPTDAAKLTEFRKVVGPALEVMIQDSLPNPDDVEVVETRHSNLDGYEVANYKLSRKGRNEAISACWLAPPNFSGQVVVWIDPHGLASLKDDHGKLVPEAKTIVDRKSAILAIDAFGTGNSPAKPMVNAKYAGFTFGYNRSFAAERVHDILSAVAFAKGRPQVKQVNLVGWASAGPWVVLARALCGSAVARTAADLDGFRFENVKTNDDPMMLPGALKYGGLPAFAALCAPDEMLLHNHRNTGTGRIVTDAYRAAGAEGKLQREPTKLPPAKVVDWLLH